MIQREEVYELILRFLEETQRKSGKFDQRREEHKSFG